MYSQEANKKRTAAEENVRIKGLVKREQKKREKLTSLGIEYDFGGYEVGNWHVCVNACVCVFLFVCAGRDDMASIQDCSL